MRPDPHAGYHSSKLSVTIDTEHVCTAATHEMISAYHRHGKKRR